jgi:hypothetical protein
MKKHTVPFFALGVMITALAATSATAQDLSQIVSGSTFSRGQDSTLVISVRDEGDRGDLCGNGFSFPRPGGSSESFDFPHPGRRISADFPRSPRTMGNVALGSLRYFQLPADSKTPDIVGCLDPQQNILFLTIQRSRPSLPKPPVSAPAVPSSPGNLQSPLPSQPTAPEQTIQTQIFRINSGSQNPTPNSRTLNPVRSDSGTKLRTPHKAKGSITGQDPALNLSLWV